LDLRMGNEEASRSHRALRLSRKCGRVTPERIFL
jgi:hypothetical protein